MKILFLSLSLLIGIANAEPTNGVFYIDNSVECHVISQNGIITTNQYVGGKTYTVGNTMVELLVSNQTTFYFSGGPMIEVGTNSIFSITIFDQEVKNLDVTPRRAEFGSHNLSLTLDKGEFSIIYPNFDVNSLLTINTPFISYELNGGKYFIRLSDKSVVVYVIEGTMQVTGDKQTDKFGRGKLAMAVPFVDPSSGVEDKIVTSIKSLKQEETNRFTSPVSNANKKWGNSQFFVIDGRIIGVWIK